MQSTNNEINVVTTNYDRVCEYAADMANLFYSTGFSSGIIQRRNQKDVNPPSKNQKQTDRIVKVWKVHGSIDWFSKENSDPMSLPLPSTIYPEHTPLIVTPGKTKHEKTSDEPFRSIITKADHSLANARAFICIGYGFEDKHIHTKLLERFKHKPDIPIAVIAKKLTEKTKKFLQLD